MHMYTGIQLGLFALLYVIKSIKMIAIAFPVVIAICIPIRLYILPKIFLPHELILLDSEDDEIEEWIGKNVVEDDDDVKSQKSHKSDHMELAMIDSETGC